MGPTTGGASLLYRNIKFCRHVGCKHLSKTGSGHPICGELRCRKDTQEYNDFMTKNGLDPKEDPDAVYWESLKIQKADEDIS